MEKSNHSILDDAKYQLVISFVNMVFFQFGVFACSFIVACFICRLFNCLHVTNVGFLLFFLKNLIYMRPMKI